MTMTSSRTTLCRYVAIGVFGISGSALAFWAGAHIGSKLDHQTRTVSVAHVPIPQLQPAPEPQAAPPSVVAHR